MKKEKILNDPLIKKIMPLIKQYEVWLVGGYIRDLELSKKSNDYDLAVNKISAKDFSKQLCSLIDGHFIELDSERGIYRIVANDKITYFDIVNFEGGCIENDCKRRDFTINSIYFNLNTGEFYNYNKDIQNKILKTENLNNLIDDPLRMLRVFRFKALSGFEIDPDIISFIEQNYSLIKKPAPERINFEILKLMGGQYASAALLEAYQTGLLGEIFPFIKDLEKVPPNSHHHLDLIHHSIETVGQIEIILKDIKMDEKRLSLLKLAAFVHDIGKPSTWKIDGERHRFIGHDVEGSKIIQGYLRDLKFSKKQISYVSKLIKYHIYPSSLTSTEGRSEKALARYVRKIEDESADLIYLAKADRLSVRGPSVTQEMIDRNLDNLNFLLDFYNRSKESVKPIEKLLSGNEIMALLNIKPSKKLGQIMNSLKEVQLNGDITTKAQAIDFIIGHK